MGELLRGSRTSRGVALSLRQRRIKARNSLIERDYLREAVRAMSAAYEVVDALTGTHPRTPRTPQRRQLTGDRDRTIFWFRNTPIAEYAHQTAEQLVAMGKTDAVIAWSARNPSVRCLVLYPELSRLFTATVFDPKGKLPSNADSWKAPAVARSSRGVAEARQEAEVG